MAYTHKQELCQETAPNADVSRSEEKLVTTGAKYAVATSSMDLAWREWMCVIPANRTWIAWKTHWTQAFQEKRELLKLTCTAFNEMANQATKLEMGNTMQR